MSRARKICVLGMFGVGKTSLVDRVAFDRFSADYKSTIGVRPVPATLRADTTAPQRVVLWDIAGESDVSRLTRTYLVGADGFAIVMDGLRLDTVDAAKAILKSCHDEFPKVPTILLANKADLGQMWDLELEAIRTKFGTQVHAVSARSGDGVHDAFCALLDAGGDVS